MNPVLRAILLQHILQLNQPIAAWGGEDGFGKVADKLVEQNVEDIEWLDPRHAPDPDTINKLQAAIDGLPLLAPVKANLLHKRDAVLHAATIIVASEGVLLKEDGTVELFSEKPVVAGQIALTIGADKKLEQIGQAKDTGWSIDSVRAATVPDGSLVFIVSATK